MKHFGIGRVGLVLLATAAVCLGQAAVASAALPPGWFESVSAGGYHNCGVRTDGVVACWGRDGTSCQGLCQNPGLPPPTNKAQCKHRGWKSFGTMFKNQGDCVSYVATGGKNPPSGG